MGTAAVVFLLIIRWAQKLMSIQYKFSGLIIVILALLAVAPFSHAADTDKTTLTITPPLIKNNINPGQSWQSYVKAVNNNARAIDIYVQVKDFKSGDENGSVEFMPDQEDGASSQYRLSQWIVMDKGPFTVPAFQSKEILFTIKVPEGAEPGSHNAAILIGNTPPEGETKGTTIKVSSLIASLLLVNVAGDTDERADIREFSTSKKFYSNENIDFTVRIENKGNIYILPQGQIRITDFFGKERGLVPINHDTGFGNILPGSTRKWDFGWQAGRSLLDMGRYQADLVVNYGKESVETVEMKTYFWVIYIKPLVFIFGGLALFILLFIFFIRWNVRKAMRAAGVYEETPIRKPAARKEKRIARKNNDDDSVLDLRRK